MSRTKVFVGIGSGAIQLGLWCYYAWQQDARVVLTEVDAEKVKNIRRNGNCYSINIALFDQVKSVNVGPVEIYNPLVKEDRNRIVDSIKAADDIVTAVPSTVIYSKGGIAALLREGLQGRTIPVIVYASENQIGAARMLEKLVFPEGTPESVKFAETVIERMGGPHTDKGFIAGHNLTCLTPQIGQALLVEDFDKIIVEKVDPGERYQTCFTMFYPTAHIELFEDLKLLGHNALHFLMGCIGKLKHHRYMSDFQNDPDYVQIGLKALEEETGGWFTVRYGDSGEMVATPRGFHEWATQLAHRIINPFLFDAVDRIVRDPARKLGWNDRIIGTMRKALATGIRPRLYALGAAAAVLLYDPRKNANEPLEYQSGLTAEDARAALNTIWGGEADKNDKEALFGLIGPSIDIIKKWKSSNSGNLADYIN